MSWALASPVGSSPDDDFHLASIWCANAANVSACQAGDSTHERMLPPVISNIACYAHKTSVTASCQEPYLELGSAPSLATDRGSFQNEYPPVYYAFMSVFVSSDVLGSAILMRLVNILIFIGMTCALFVLLPHARRPTLIWGWVLTTVPLGLFLLASNNPSAWALIGVGSAWIALLGYFETRGRRKAALAVVFALSAIIAAGSRADSALYLILSVAIVLGLTFAKTKRYLVSAALPIVFSCAAAFFFLGAKQSAVVVSGLGSGADNSSDPVTLLIKNLGNIPELWVGTLGGSELGWLDTTMPGVVTFGATLAFAGVVFVGITHASSRKVVALALVALALWLLPAYVLVKGMNEVGENVQARYVLPLMVLFAGLAMLAVRSEPFHFTRMQLMTVMGLLATAESVALYVNLRRYVVGVDAAGWDLGADMGWWWDTAISPMFVWMIGSIAYAVLLVILVQEISGTTDKTSKAHEEITRVYETA